MWGCDLFLQTSVGPVCPKHSKIVSQQLLDGFVGMEKMQ